MERYNVSAPTRADLAGGTLDLWPVYSILGGGKTINVGLDLCAQVTFEISQAVAFRAEVSIMGGPAYTLEEPFSYEAHAQVPPALQFPVHLLCHLLRQQESQIPEKCLHIKIETQAPLRSGLGGSSTLCVALIRGLWEFLKVPVKEGWQWKMVDWAKDVEAAHLNTPTGIQDYLGAIYGGLSCFGSDIGGWRREAYSPAVFTALSERLLVLFSGEMHSSGWSNWEVYKRFIEGDKEVKRGFCGIRDIAEELDQNLKSASIDWKKIGVLLSQEWVTRRETFRVNTPRLDEIVSFVRSLDILGVKVCGAASGGSLVVLVDPAKKDQVRKQIEEKEIQVLNAKPLPAGLQIAPLPSK